MQIPSSFQTSFRLSKYKLLLLQPKIYNIAFQFTQTNIICSILIEKLPIYIFELQNLISSKIIITIFFRIKDIHWFKITIFRHCRHNCHGSLARSSF
ncbi:hypothetical protein DMR_08870 [Solidesulfovibrio magneticus RS-1]|uniref:Uncharacterized protein n=1 Tax=Solidesulfovibrio magneticus (strain ATCC 700980 / DSM 13731 / RS-1) TaxID=573370 RepID=C4XK23_SOLM1|nr:hypothetical protein DMR_08870 [Solidesulfovibrio magneticus RS-1]